MKKVFWSVCLFVCFFRNVFDRRAFFCWSTKTHFFEFRPNFQQLPSGFRHKKAKLVYFARFQTVRFSKKLGSRSKLRISENEKETTQWRMVHTWILHVVMQASVPEYPFMAQYNMCCFCVMVPALPTLLRLLCFCLLKVPSSDVITQCLKHTLGCVTNNFPPLRLLCLTYSHTQNKSPYSKTHTNSDSSQKVQWESGITAALPWKKSKTLKCDLKIGMNPNSWQASPHHQNLQCVMITH